MTSQSGTSSTSEADIDRTDDGRPIFKTEHYDKLEWHGAVRILTVFPGHPGDLEVHCELILGTILDEKERKRVEGSPKFVPYDALSWCWGTQSEESWISIRKDGTRYAKAVKSDLVAALRALRHHEHDRLLWIDAVCIDQNDVLERNHQVEMMADIYGKADCVRIWLGNPTESSNLAIRFIKKEVLQLQHFDELCESKEASAKWKSLLELMQRPWFSRRWVVQEVALARKAIIHCGSAKIAWSKFAVAVELFVEVETATHRLSEVMKKDPKYYHVPMWFEYVSALGASLLVDATGKLFREYEYRQRLPETKARPALKMKLPIDPDEDANYESEDDELLSPHARAKLYETNDPASRLAPKGQPLLNLEYLVCSLSIFDTTKPHDTIYALLGIAKDTTPTAANKKLHVLNHTQAALEMFTEKKQYSVDYQASYVDVCKEFIQFAINRSLHVDPSRALDVICRPWATEEIQSLKNAEESSMPLPSWVPQLSKASYGMDTKPGVEGMKMGRKNADALVGLPSLTQRNYNAAETKGLDKRTFRFRKRVAKKVAGAENPGSSEKQVDKTQQKEPDAEVDATKPKAESEAKESSQTKDKDAEAATKQEEGHEIPENDGKEPNATTSSEKESSTSVKVKVAPQVELNYYSMYVKGFILDKVQEVQPSSQNGSIPSEWADFAGWKRMQGTPPDHFWRTLVADRGRDGKNPPIYYSRACKESFTKGSFQSGSVDTTGLINNERNSVVAQFCRRVQAAIWNRALIRTESEKLGLVAKNVQAEDFVCILYGCSVPVILRKHGPKDQSVMDFEMAWELKHLADLVGSDYKKHLDRKELFRAKRETDAKEYMKWEQKKREEWKNDKEWHEKWKKARVDLMVIHSFNSWANQKRAEDKNRDAKPNAERYSKMQDYVNVTVTDKCRRPPTDQEKEFWEEFTNDEAWREKWKAENSRFLEEDGFKAWLRKEKRLPRYPEEWKASRDEWKNDTQWKENWEAENSRFLCIDSFRAWLRVKGKFFGPEEHVYNKRDWEEDEKWRKEWRLDNKNATEQEEFDAWMRKEGRKNTVPQEAKTKEERSQYDDWKKYWRLDHPEASLDVEFEAWKAERESRAKLEDDIHKMKSEAAKKQEIEPFLERWRKGWTPPTVNWIEFQLALCYGRRWKKHVIRRKKDFSKQNEGIWSSPEARKNRQEEKRSNWEQFKMNEEKATRELQDRIANAKVKDGSEGGIEPQNGHQDKIPQTGSQVDGGEPVKSATSEKGINGSSPTAMSNGDTGAGAEKDGNRTGEDTPPRLNLSEKSKASAVKPNKTPSDDDKHENATEPDSKPTCEDQPIPQRQKKAPRTDRDFSTLFWGKMSEEERRTAGKVWEQLTHGLIKSKADLEERIAARKSRQREIWESSVSSVKEDLEHFKRNTPFLIRADGKKYFDCVGKNGEEKIRKRLNEAEKAAYQKRIASNFKASLGDDGRWWYQMLGECYIHGNMDGEAMAYQNERGIQTTVFEIR